MARHQRISKGKISLTLGSKLNKGRDEAIERAKKLIPFKNQSTTVYLLIEELEEAGNK